MNMSVLTELILGEQVILVLQLKTRALQLDENQDGGNPFGPSWAKSIHFPVVGDSFQWSRCDLVLYIKVNYVC